VLYVRAVLARRSRPLRRLLGIDRRMSGSVRILISSIHVVRGGANGVARKPTGFRGPVMNQSEYVSALRLTEAIQSRPAARLLRALLDQLGLLDAVHDPIDCSVTFSPQYTSGRKRAVAEDVESALAAPGVYILVGGPVYNAAVHHVLTNLHDRTRFRFDEPEDPQTPVRGIYVNGYQLNGGEAFFERRLETSEAGAPCDYFILQKISEFGVGRSTVFLCCGLGSLGTAMAVGKLSRDWESLERAFHGDDFELLYRFDIDHDVVAPTAEDVDRALDGVTTVWERSVPPSRLAPVPHVAAPATTQTTTQTAGQDEPQLR